MQLESSVTLFDDNKVEDRFAQLQVTADGITAEVSRKVGNNEIISRINQSAEAVTIQANKINIDGAITAINNNSTTTINGGKITTGTLSASAVNANSGTFNTANIPNLNASKITAGTLSADRIGAGTLSVGKIDASSGTFSTANIPDLNASKITAGTLDAARIGASSIAIGKLDSNAQTTISNAAKTATSYITAIDSNNGVTIHAANNASSNYAKINASGMEVYKGGSSVAMYGDSARIGKEASNHISIAPASFDVYDSNSYSQFSVTPTSKTSSTDTWIMHGQVASGSTWTTPLPSTASAIKAKVKRDESDSYTIVTLTIPSSSGATTTATVASYSVYTLRKNADSTYTLTVTTSAAFADIGVTFTSTHKVANIMAGGYKLCYTAGDTIDYYEYRGATYLSNSKTSLYLSLPINKPILAEGVSVSDVGVITRQDGSYTHGSSATNPVPWTVDEAYLTDAGIWLTVSRSTTTNSTNNSPIGVNLTCAIKFL